MSTPHGLGNTLESGLLRPRNLNADGSQPGSATGESSGGSDYIPLCSTDRHGFHSLRPHQSCRMPYAEHWWVHYGAVRHGPPSACWGRQHWLPRGQPCRSPHAGDDGNVNAMRPKMRRHLSTRYGNSLLCYHGQHRTGVRSCDPPATWRYGQWQSWVVRPPRELAKQPPYQSSYRTPATKVMKGYWGPLYQLMEYGAADSTNDHLDERELPVVRTAPQHRRRKVRVRVRPRRALHRRPPTDPHKCQGLQSGLGPQCDLGPPG